MNPCSAVYLLPQGTEAGGADSWLGNLQIDPTKGKRAVSAPGDEHRTVTFTQLLAHTAPGEYGCRYWVTYTHMGRRLDWRIGGLPHQLAAVQSQGLYGFDDLSCFQQLYAVAGHDVRAWYNGSWSVLFCAAPSGRPAEDAWLGNISIDPSKGKGHAADPSSLRGRADLFAIMQQKALQQNGSSGCANDSSRTAAEADAWIGNRCGVCMACIQRVSDWWCAHDIKQLLPWCVRLASRMTAAAAATDWNRH